MATDPENDALISRLTDLWGAASDMMEVFENSPPEVQAMLRSISKAYEKLFDKYGSKGMLIECHRCQVLVEDETGEVEEHSLLGIRRDGEGVAYCENCAAGFDYCNSCGSVTAVEELVEMSGRYYCSDCV